MARVNVEHIALTDPRFAILAQCMGVADADFALGKMVRVWHYCTERETHVLTKEIIVGLFGFREEAPLWLVRADLAEEVDGGLRIKGTSGRIEWITKKRASARKNGRKGGRPGGIRKETNVGSSGFPPETPLTLTPALTLAPAPKEEKHSASQSAAPPPAAAEKPKPPRKEPDGPHHEFIRIFTDAWFAKYGLKYAFNAGKDGTAIKWFRDQVGDDVEQFRKVVRTYLEDNSEFIVGARHSIGNLRAQWVRWAVPPPPGHSARAGPVGDMARNLQTAFGIRDDAT